MIASLRWFRGSGCAVAQISCHIAAAGTAQGRLAVSCNEIRRMAY
jgi:hypothetical protein